MSIVQSVTFPRASFSPRAALKWLKVHDFDPIKKVDKTATRLRYRLHDPGEFVRFATRSVKDGVDLVIGFTEAEEQPKPDPFPVSSQTKGPPGAGGARSNPNTWLAHVKAYRVDHPGVSYKDALKAASATWKKAK